MNIKYSILPVGGKNGQHSRGYILGYSQENSGAPHSFLNSNQLIQTKKTVPSAPAVGFGLLSPMTPAVKHPASPRKGY
jgi:hypothetical protein